MLTEISIKSLTAKEKQYKKSDGKGLFLIITPNGSKRWVLKYFVKQTTAQGVKSVEKSLAFGNHPKISLKEARQKRDEALELLERNIDPAEKRKSDKVKNGFNSLSSFEAIAREWFNTKIKGGEFTPSHAKKVMARFEKDVFPYIGKLEIKNIKVIDLLNLARKIEERGAIDTAHRAIGSCKQVFAYALITGRVERNPAKDLEGALVSPKKGHFAALTEPNEVAGLLKAIYGYKGSLIVSSALKFASLVFVRPNELRHAKWEDINFKTKEWRYFVSKTKTPFIVPLARQAIEILKNIQPFTEQSQYVFPSPTSFSRPMSNNAVLAAFRRMGITKEEMSGHGFRAMARTMLDEQLHYPVEIIEQQLAHKVKDPLGRAYNRTSHMAERKEMMQTWADYLDELRAK